MTQPRIVFGGLAAAVVVIVLAWFVLVLRPIGEEIDDVRAELAQAEQQEQSLRMQLERLRAIDEERPALQAELQRLNAAIPPQPELATFILAAHELAARAEVDFVSITPAPPAPVADLGVSVISMAIRTEGRFFNVLDYLDRLEEHQRIVVVDGVTLTASVAEIEEEEGEGAAAAGTAGDAGMTDRTTTVMIVSEFGEVTTDQGTLTVVRHAESPDDGRVEAALVPSRAEVPPGEVMVTVELQARTFTSEVPRDEESAEPPAEPPPTEPEEAG